MTVTTLHTAAAQIPAPTVAKICRFCRAPLERTFVDLGMSPLCETYPTHADFSSGEIYYPLHTYVCDSCFLVQLEEFESPAKIFGEYPYFSSYSDSWLKHCEKYCDKMIDRFGLSRKSLVAEVASNDGYLLQYFVKRVKETKMAFVEFLLDAAKNGKKVAGYGAPGKSATLLHYAGVGRDFIEYTVDRNPYKQGRFLPGTHIPIHHPDRIRETKPDFVVILPWNLKDEIVEQIKYIREWGGRFVVPIPKLEIS